MKRKNLVEKVSFFGKRANTPQFWKLNDGEVPFCVAG